MIRIYTLEYTLYEGKNKREREHSAGIRLLRDALRHAYGIRVFTAAAGEGGKPYLTSHPDIYFNISHSQGLAVCAVGDLPLGIDVERIRPFRPSVMRRVLGGCERQELESCGREEELQSHFFRLWTLKESCVKADGAGLRIPLDEITFSFLPDGRILCSREGCGFWQRRISGDYWLSLCWMGESCQEQVEMVTMRWEE